MVIRLEDCLFWTAHVRPQFPLYFHRSAHAVLVHTVLDCRLTRESKKMSETHASAPVTPVSGDKVDAKKRVARPKNQGWGGTYACALLSEDPRGLTRMRGC